MKKAKKNLKEELKENEIKTLLNCRCCLIWLKVVEKSKYKVFINKALRELEKLIEIKRNEV